MKTRIAAIAATVFVMGFAGASFAGNGQMSGNRCNGQMGANCGNTQQGQQLRKQDGTGNGSGQHLRKRDGTGNGSGQQQGKRIQKKDGSGINPNTGQQGKGRAANGGVCPNK